MNTTVIIILIGCATAIALVAIICDHLFEKKTEPTECLMSKKIIKIHRNYIAGFLGFAVIMLVTYKYGGPQNAIFTYLSFGSTITSMVLSILAIFVTVQSSSDMYKQFTRIDNATDTIKNASNQIEGTLDALRKAENDLQTTSNNISKQLDNIIEQIDDRISVRMKETEGNLSKLMSESLSVSIKTKDDNIQSTPRNTNELKKFFTNNTSAIGLLSIYACALSNEKNKKFELSKLFTETVDYVHGFLMAIGSTPLADINYDSTTNEITCQKSEFSSSELIEKIKEVYINLSKGKDIYLKMANKTNEFFGVDPLEIKTE